jgi:hypothetical protein
VHKEHEVFIDQILKQSLKEVKEGNVIPHDVAMKQAAQWLKESSK